MKANELLKAIASEIELNQTDVSLVLKGLATITERVLKDWGELVIPGIAKISTTDIAARTGRNPQTWEALQIGAYTKVKFKTVKGLKDSIK